MPRTNEKQVGQKVEKFTKILLSYIRKQKNQSIEEYILAIKEAGRQKRLWPLVAEAMTIKGYPMNHQQAWNYYEEGYKNEVLSPMSSEQSEAIRLYIWDYLNSKDINIKTKDLKDSAIQHLIDLQLYDYRCITRRVLTLINTFRLKIKNGSYTTNKQTIANYRIPETIQQQLHEQKRFDDEQTSNDEEQVNNQFLDQPLLQQNQISFDASLDEQTVDVSFNIIEDMAARF